MKQFILSLTAIAFATTLSAQTVNVHFKNGQKVQFNADNVDYVDFSIKAPDPTVSAGQVVDLGLSVYWASCNLGAEKPEEYGDYYAWGESKPKSEYKIEYYSYFDGNINLYIEIGNDISGTEYDAATVNLGSDWRIPTKDELRELMDKCTWEWTQINGTNGYKITGPNGNSIFLPASGWNLNYLSNLNRDLYYLTSTQANSSSHYSLVKNQASVTSLFILTAPKERGSSIRPVTTNPNATGGSVDHSNDYLVTDKVTASFMGGAYSMINGRILSGSQLNVKFNNGSSEQVTLIGLQLNDASNGAEGDNLLDSEVDVAAGESKSYTVTVGWAGVTTPVIRFTYRYNRKKYVAEATWTD